MPEARAPASTAGEDIPEGLRDRWEWCAGRGYGFEGDELVRCPACRERVTTERCPDVFVPDLDFSPEVRTVRHLRRKAVSDA